MRAILMGVVSLLVVGLFAIEAYACQITFEPSSVKVDAAGKATVTIVVTWEHKRCVLDDDDVNIDYVGVKLLKEGEWISGKPGLFKKTVEVQLTGTEGTVTVWRECSKKGRSEGSIKITR